MRILIFAAGPIKRGWTESAPKQLALIEGRPLILRTLDQLGEREAVVVTHNEAIQRAVPVFFDPPAHRWWAETLLSTISLWKERTTVLNGDVVFSPEALRAIMDSKSDIRFYGTKDEAFGVTFVKRHWEKVIASAKQAVDYNTAVKKCLVWHFYRAFNGLPLDGHTHNPDAYQVAPLDDYTIDIDSVRRYKKFLEANTWA